MDTERDGPELKPGEPNGTKPGWTRLALAIVIAPLVLAAVLTLAAYVIAGIAELGRAGALERTREAGAAFFLFLPLFSVTVGLAGVLALRRLGWHGGLAWLVSGAILGALSAAGLGLIGAQGLVGTHVAIFAVLGLCLFALIRQIAGIRTR
ncbi:MAG: hypothetical protein OEN23_18275 [Paracoccaceae bacterium]|nr:hypothetical protein [Paracoccaceae bacterium]